MSQVDLEQPDLQKFPRFGRAKRYELMLEPGDMLFIPAFWWHQENLITQSASTCGGRRGCPSSSCGS